MILTFSLMLQNYLFWFFENIVTVEKAMVSLERCLKYTNIPQEKEYTLNQDNTDREWPVFGEIKFVNYSVKYREETPIVLKNINLYIEGNKRIGIVGRTGSGKSTLVLSLLRLLEPYSGTIYIDGVDFTTIGLNLLRKNITVIPQVNLV